ncbi:MAG TPA: hypothetical protein VIX17_00565, partial [Pyrinomonadaceae bacterium]
MKILLIIAAIIVCLFPIRVAHQQTPPLYKNPSLPIDQRVNDLVSRMTLEEKVSQMMNGAAA